MPRIEEKKPSIDWSLTTWEGSRRAQLRRWAELSLEEIIQAQEEMRELAEKLGAADRSERSRTTTMPSHTIFDKEARKRAS